MLDVINRLMHGFVAVPVMLACRRAGLLERAGWADALRPGHRGAALRLLESVGWVREGVTLPDAAAARFVPDDVLGLYPLALDGGFAEHAGALEAGARRVAARWDGAPGVLADMLDGTVVVPVLNGMLRAGLLEAWRGGDCAGVPGAVRALFAAKGWAAADVLTEAGRFVAERAMITGTTASYAPLLARMDDVLHGADTAALARDAAGRERHLDRGLNVVASGFQHQRYFSDFEDVVVALFDSEELGAQPGFIVDSGCGDGTLLRLLYQAVRDRTRRGRALEAHPLVMVGADLNAEALAITARTLADVPHLCVAVDIGDPAALQAALAAHGASDALHVRSFLDHDRLFRAPTDGAAAAARAGLPYDLVAVAGDGGAIAPGDAVQSLVEHLVRWRDAAGTRGFVALEVHSLPAVVAGRYLDEAENLHFDAYHAFSHQHLVTADTFLLAAAECGLLPARVASRRYPRTLPFTRITLNHFVPSPWRVRTAREADVPALLALEAACWPAGMRADGAALAARLRAHPLLQVVAERDGRVVGAAYAQRIADADVLRTATVEGLAALSVADGPVVQLLGMNVLPEAQDQGLGDRLLDFAVVLYRAVPGVASLAGVTRCRDHQPGLRGIAEHVARLDAEGLPVDPILRFHVRHGARVVGVVPGFRAADVANEGAGVLIAYDDGAAARAGVAGEGAVDLAAVWACVVAVRDPGEYAPDRAFRELGFDSLDLLELRALLGRRTGRALEATVFFSHPTASALVRFLAGVGAGDGGASSGAMPKRIAPYVGADAIAIVGMACRFPGGVDSPEAYWELLREGRDGVTEVPARSWDAAALHDPVPGAPGRIISRAAGVLEGVELFDAGFFGMTPREARLADPQQRLLLEVSHEALERAGIAPDGLRGTATGIYVGLFGHDYEQRLLAAGTELDAYYSTGNAAAVAAGRLAYFFGTQGPALTLDTACSASLVAVHLAVRSLRSGETSLALAGGVNLLLTPALSIAFSRAGMLAADGRCRTFDAAADGYVRSEGCGVVVLRRLADALAAGDPVVAVIRGSAVNQDGASNGLTAPNGLAQEAVLRQALADAGVAGADVGYVEAHGTGTPLGDPVEVAALDAVYGPGRASPLLIGSAKASIGHAEAAAGLAGLMKAALSVQAGWVPPLPHFRRANPALPLGRVAVAAEGRAWPERAGPRRAGVSAFGFSGTNAHVVIEAAPALGAEARGAVVLPISARSPAALARLVAAYGAALDDATLGALCRTAALGRAHHPVRVAVAGRDAAGLRAALAQAVLGGAGPRVGFVFTGQGSQYAGMAAGLYRDEAVFRGVMDRCEAVLPGLLDVVAGRAEGLGETGWTQPALFAVGAGLAALWASWGVRPAVVLGHSVGEFAAAVAAGCLGLEEALGLVVARGRLMQALPAGGGMLAVLAAAGVAEAAIGRFGDTVGVAAYNGPRNTVLAGSLVALEAIRAGLDALGVASVPLAVSHAFHSPLMEPMLAEFSVVAAGVGMAAPGVAFVSTVGGGPTEPGYWVRHARAPVRFAEAVAALAGQVDVLLEIGPQPVLIGLARHCVAGEGGGPALLASLRPGVDEREAMLGSLARLYAAGAAVDWAGVHGAGGARMVAPTTPFDRQRHWVESGVPAVAAGEHPLLGARMKLAGAAEVRFGATVGARTLPFFDEHRLRGRVVVPAASHVSTALLGLGRLGGGWALADLLFPHPFRLGDDEASTTQLVIAREGGRPTGFRLLSAPAGEEEPEWVLHAEGRVEPAGAVPGPVDLAAVRAACPEESSGAAFYAGFRRGGYELGRSLARIEAVWRGADEVLARVGSAVGAGGETYGIYPGVLDACFQVMGVWFGVEGLAERRELFVPFTMGRLVVHAPAPNAALWSHAVRERRADGEGREVRGDLRIMTGDGVVIAEVQGFEFRRVSADALLDAGGAIEPLVPGWEAAGGQALAEVARAAAPVLPDADGCAAVDALAVAYLQAALADGVEFAPAHWRLAGWLPALLDGAGDGDLMRLRAEARAAGAAVQPAVDLVERTGPRLAEVLRGEVSPVGLLFPEGDIAPLGRLYAEASGFSAMNAALGAACSGLGGGRVLEIGGGTGGSTSWVLDALGGRCREYVFTDVSEAFLAAARSRFGGRFGGRAGFGARRLDIEQAPGGQGFAAGSFDLVVAANVLHATRDVRASLRHAVSLLAPGGALVLLEGTAPRHWVDLTFGLTEGWWRFSDTGLRGEHPLLPGDVWAGLLGELGLEVAVVPGGRGLLFDQALVMGRRGAGVGDWLVVRDAGGLEARVLERGWAGVALVAEGDVEAACRPVLEGLQGLERAGFSGRVVVATRDAVAAVAGDGVSGVGGSAVWGLAGVAGLEHPEWGLRRVDLGAGDDDGVLLAECGRDDGEDQVAWRSGRRLVARLVRRAWPGAVQSTFRDPSNSPVMAGLDPAIHVVPPDQAADGHAHNGSGSGQRHGVDRRIKSGDDVFGEPGAVAPMAYRGTWLVTGGLGGLGRAVAGWLLGRGVARVVLVGRHGGDAGIAGAEVRVADVRDRGALGAVVAEFAGELRGVVHAAGVLDDGALGSLDWGRFEGVLGAKVLGAGHLDALTAGLELDGFVLFSSAASLLGNAGQANHAAANAWLDGLAQRRRAAGRPGLSVNWGLWSETGSAVAAAEGMRARGYLPISTAAGLDALGRALESGWAQVCVSPMAWEKVAPRASLSGLQAVRVAALPVEAPAGDPEDVVAALVAAVLGSDGPVGRETGLFGAGLDSLMSVELRNRMQIAFGLALPTTVAFDHPTIAALGRHVRGLLSPEPGMSEAEAEALIEAEMAAMQARG